MPSVLKVCSILQTKLTGRFCQAQKSRVQMGMQTVKLILALEMGQRPWALLWQRIETSLTYGLCPEHTA